MADITRHFWLRHFRGTPTTFVRHLRHGSLAHEGTGLSFWFHPLSAVISEVPVHDNELPLLFHARTADFQDVTVQATVTFRVTDPALAASRIDFSVDPDRGVWRAKPLDQVAGMLTEAAQQNALDLLAGMQLTEALVDGSARLRERIENGLAADTRLAETGVAAVGVRVVAVRPEPELEKALQMPAREQVQQEADRATYERRALAVERERAISENELQSQIELARREEDLVAQRGTNARRQAEEVAAANAIETEAQASREQKLAQVRAEATKAMGQAAAAGEAARVAAYSELGEATLLALALREMAAQLGQVHSLVITPDLLAPVLARLSLAANPPAPADKGQPA